MPNVSPLALVDPLTGDLTAPRLRAVPSPLPPASLASLVAPLSLTSPGAAGIYRLPDAAPDASLVGYLVLVPVGTELDVTAVPARVPAPATAPPAATTAPAATAPVTAPPVTAPLAVTAAPGAEAAEPAAPVEVAHGVTLDLERRTVRIDGEPLELTYLEFELLAHLTRNPHRVHTRDHLVSAVWGYGHVGDGRTVDVHVARLRRKLGRHREGIVTVRRVGYKYVPANVR